MDRLQMNQHSNSSSLAIWNNSWLVVDACLECLPSLVQLDFVDAIVLITRNMIRRREGIHRLLCFCVAWYHKRTMNWKDLRNEAGREVSLGTKFCELRKPVYYFRCMYSVRKARCLHRPYQPYGSPEDLEKTKEDEKHSV